MAFTFDMATDLGKVRFKVGDTVDEGHLVEDATITALLEEHGSVTAAAREVCLGIAAMFSREFDFQTDDQRFQRSQRAKAYRELAAQLTDEGGGDLSTIETVRDDGYSAGIGNEETDADIAGGRIRAGYNDPDIHP